jgi:hypothetical protein
MLWEELQLIAPSDNKNNNSDVVGRITMICAWRQQQQQ